MKNNNKGFTLAEMLIVVAIIGVLIAIVSSTIFDAIERSREARDLANIRNAFSELLQEAELGGEHKSYIRKFSGDNPSYCLYIKSCQKEALWQSKNYEFKSGYLKLNDIYITAPYKNNDGSMRDVYQVLYYVNEQAAKEPANPEPFHYRVVIIPESSMPNGFEFYAE